MKIVYGVSGNTRTWWDNTGAERLGYRPEDDAESWAETVMATAPEDPDAPGADVQGGAFTVLESGAGLPPPTKNGDWPVRRGGDDMSGIVGRLCREHRNIGALLDMLERMLDALESASDAPGDAGLMRDIMTYMTRFPDHTHHPMEDLMFERMRARGIAPQTEHTIGKLLHEHTSLARKGEALRLALLRFEDGARSERPALVAMGRDYVEFLRFHAQLEERTVFVEAESLLGDADWTEIERAFEERTDPVFGPRVDSEFRALYQHIKNTAYLRARGTD